MSNSPSTWHGMPPEQRFWATVHIPEDRGHGGRRGGSMQTDKTTPSGVDNDAKRRNDYERGYIGHGRGVVVTNDGSGNFSERPMTAGEMAARDPAWTIGADPYEFLTAAAAFAYIRCWEVIAPAIDAALDSRDAALREANSLVEMHQNAWRTLNDDGGKLIAQKEAALREAREVAEQLQRKCDGERAARHKCEAALTQKDKAMGILFERMAAANIDFSDLIP